MTPTKAFLLGLRVLMETGVVAGLAFWGYRTGGSTGIRVLLAIAAPLVGFGIWGAVDFHRAGPFAEPLRLVEELAISGLAAAGLVATGAATLGWALATISVVYHALVYLTGHRLLTQPQRAPRDTTDRKEPSWTGDRRRTTRP